MENVGAVPAKPYTDISWCIAPGERCHEYISCETSEHDKSESLRLSDSRITRDEEEYHPKCEELSRGICYEGELGSESWLEIAHEWAIYESGKSEESSDSDTESRSRAIVSAQSQRYEKWECDDDDTRECAEGEDIARYLLDHGIIVFMSWELSHGDGIESEIGDDSEDREVVIYLRVEPISSDIEIVREDFYHHDGDKRGEDFPPYLCERVGIYLSSRHMREYREKERKGKNEKKKLEIRKRKL